MATAVWGFVNMAIMNTIAARSRRGLEQGPALGALVLDVVGGDSASRLAAAAPSAAGASTLTSYPAASTAFTSSSRPASPGSTRTVAFSVARLTEACSTPGVLLRNRSMRLTHEAQVMPSIGRTISMGRGASEDAVILGGSIAAGRQGAGGVRRSELGGPEVNGAADGRGIGTGREVARALQLTNAAVPRARTTTGGSGSCCAGRCRPTAFASDRGTWRGSTTGGGSRTPISSTSPPSSTCSCGTNPTAT